MQCTFTIREYLYPPLFIQDLLNPSDDDISHLWHVGISKRLHNDKLISSLHRTDHGRSYDSILLVGVLTTLHKILRYLISPGSELIISPGM